MSWAAACSFTLSGLPVYSWSWLAQKRLPRFLVFKDIARAEP
jgi:hypothetical protein